MNRLVLGNNVQWVDRGDEMLSRDGRQLRPRMLERAKALGPTILRFPGGAMSDLFRWKDGTGEPEQRGLNEHFFSRQMQRVLMGTREFLELCEALGVEAIITVNTATGSPKEAAQWVAYVNRQGLRSSRTGELLAKVRYWEIGNEPYLKDDKQKRLWIAPEAFAARANDFIRAMKDVDPDIQVGIPLRSDRLGGVAATPYPGYNATLLANVSMPFDFVSLHNAYLPFGFDKPFSDRDLLQAALAASVVVAADFEATRQLLRQYKPGRSVALAVTEFNALFSLGGKPSDNYTASPAGALYVADLLCLFAVTPDLLMANFWSLSGNWVFGSFASSGEPRPAYHVLRLFNAVLRGRLLPVAVQTPGFESPAVGFVPAQQGQPRVTALATLDEGNVRLVLINKDTALAADLTLHVAGMQTGQGSAHSLVAEVPLEVKEGDGVFGRRTAQYRIEGGRARISLPALSVTLLELKAGAGVAARSGRAKR